MGYLQQNPFESKFTESRQKRCVAAAMRRQAVCDNRSVEARMQQVIFALDPIAEAARQGWDWSGESRRG